MCCALMTYERIDMYAMVESGATPEGFCWPAVAHVQQRQHVVSMKCGGHGFLAYMWM